MTQKYLLKDKKFIPVSYVEETEKTISFKNTNTGMTFKIYKSSPYKILSFNLTTIIEEKLSPEILEELIEDCLKDNKFWIFRFDPSAKIFQYKYNINQSSFDYEIRERTVFQKLENKGILNSEEALILKEFVENFKENTYSKLYKNNFAAAMEIFKEKHPECFKVRVYEGINVYFLNLNIANEFILGSNYSIYCEKRTGYIYLVDYHAPYSQKTEVLATKENLEALAIESLKTSRTAALDNYKILFKFNSSLLYINDNGETRFTNFFAGSYIPNEDLLNKVENKNNLIKFKGLQNSGLIDKDFVVENISYNIKKDRFEV